MRGATEQDTDHERPILNLFDVAGIELSLEQGLPVDEVVRRLGVAARGGDVCHRALAFYLADMEQRRLHQAWGFSKAVDFATARLGLTRSSAYELLAAGRRLEELPRIDEAFARGELSWSKVRRMTRIATPQTEQAWIERVRDVGQAEVDALVQASQMGDAPPALDAGLPRTRFVVRLVLDGMQHEMLERAREKLECEVERTVTDQALFDELVRLFLSSDSDGTVPGRKKVDGSLFRVSVAAETGERVSGAAATPEVEAARSDAMVTARIRRHVLARDGCRCQACSSRRSLMIHHVVWREDGGATVPGNLVLLCSRCHGLVHDQYLFVSGRPGAWMFRDRRGDELRQSGPRTGRRWTVEYARADTARRPAGRPDSLEPDDIPAVVDAEWWRRHQHLLDWTPDGKGVRLERRRPTRARSA